MVKNHWVIRRGTIIPTNRSCKNHSSFLSQWKYKFEPMWTHFGYAKHIQISQEKITQYLPNHHCLNEFFDAQNYSSSQNSTEYTVNMIRKLNKHVLRGWLPCLTRTGLIRIPITWFRLMICYIRLLTLFLLIWFIPYERYAHRLVWNVVASTYVGPISALS